MCGSFWLYLRFFTDQARWRRALWEAEYNSTQRSLTGSDKTALALLATLRPNQADVGAPENGRDLVWNIRQRSDGIGNRAQCRVQLVRR